jgi:hypothetical protein
LIYDSVRRRRRRRRRRIRRLWSIFNMLSTRIERHDRKYERHLSI